MNYFTATIPVHTTTREEMVDITSEIQHSVDESGITDGICIIFSLHTTCGLTINENADPDVKRDLIEHFRRVYPRDACYRHVEGNSDAHLKVSTVGPSLTVLVSDGKLLLGTWQGIMLCEFDGPRPRKVIVRVQGD
ncbi:MAG: secondary thiamine-phosphate synthase enzyme YjbQ [Promethearchaeota archaeon]